MGRIITLSPSAFGFLYEECPACYYSEALGIRKLPRTPFPAIFTAIDLAMKRHFESQPWHRIGATEERFRMVAQGRWVKSRPIAIAGSDVELVIRGVYYSQIAFENGDRAICDFKTSPVRPELVPKYSRQLHAYAFAIEQAGCDPPGPVDRLGLAVFEPRTFFAEETNQATLLGDFARLEFSSGRRPFRRISQCRWSAVSGAVSRTKSQLYFLFVSSGLRCRDIQRFTHTSGRDGALTLRACTNNMPMCRVRR